ncbi:hypothetical protein [Actinomadura sp. DC4]|uniref:hypothetical protein n=1 Tax=Actinomadura sp. DC4 TaxID=3055069 RepID=UPI0025AFEA0F|nr:hypothetical protein [Actinomadura sp. DC4]MDN3351557.1 hypothetical protein [Actinomadura sp. DC4]
MCGSADGGMTPGFGVVPGAWGRAGNGFQQAAYDLAYSAGGLDAFYRAMNAQPFGSDELGKALFKGDEASGAPGFVGQRDGLVRDLAWTVNLLRRMGAGLAASGEVYVEADGTVADQLGGRPAGQAGIPPAAEPEVYVLPTVSGGLPSTVAAPPAWRQALWILEAVGAGSEWPDGHVGQVGELRDAARALEQVVRGVIGLVAGHSAHVTGSGYGTATDAFGSTARLVHGEAGLLADLAGRCGGLADYCGHAIDAIRRSQAQCLASAVFVVMLMRCSALLGGWTEAAVLPLIRLDGRALQIVLRAIREAVLGMTFSGGLAGIGQAFRGDFDAAELWAALWQGALAGGMIGTTNAGLPGLARHAPSVAGLLRAMESPGGKGMMARFAVGGTVGTAAMATTGWASGHGWDWKHAAETGFGMAFVGLGAESGHAAKGFVHDFLDARRGGEGARPVGGDAFPPAGAAHDSALGAENTRTAHAVPASADVAQTSSPRSGGDHVVSGPVALDTAHTVAGHGVRTATDTSLAGPPGLDRTATDTSFAGPPGLDRAAGGHTGTAPASQGAHATSGSGVPGGLDALLNVRTDPAPASEGGRPEGTSVAAILGSERPSRAAPPVVAPGSGEPRPDPRVTPQTALADQVWHGSPLPDGGTHAPAPRQEGGFTPWRRLRRLFAGPTVPEAGPGSTGGEDAGSQHPGPGARHLYIRSGYELVELRGRYANRIDPADALSHHQWVRLKESATAHDVVSDLVRSSDLRVRRMTLTEHGGAERDVTEFTLEVNYRAESPGLARTVMENAVEAVDRYYNYQHILPDHSQLHVELKFNEVVGEPTRDFVQFKGDRNHGLVERAHADLWFADMAPSVYAHEVGHHLGFPDEYIEPGVPRRGSLTAPGVRSDATLMAVDRQFMPGGDVLRDSRGSEVSAVASVLDRHIEHLHERAKGAGHGDRATGHGTKGSDDGVARPRIWRRAYHEAGLRLSPDLSQLLRDFPAGDRPIPDHAVLLDHMRELFGFEPLTSGHLRYTIELFEATRQIYGTSLHFKFLQGEMPRLHELADAFGMGFRDAAPNVGVFREKAREVLGYRPDDPVGAAEMDALARLVELDSLPPAYSAVWNTRRDSPVHGAAADLLMAPEGEATTREAVRIIADAAATDARIVRPHPVTSFGHGFREAAGFFVERGLAPRLYQPLGSRSDPNWTVSALRVVRDLDGRTVVQTLSNRDDWPAMSDDFILGGGHRALSSPSSGEAELQGLAGERIADQLSQAGFERVPGDHSGGRLWKYGGGPVDVVVRLDGERVAGIYAADDLDALSPVIANSRFAHPLFASDGEVGLRFYNDWLSYTVGHGHDPISDALITGDVRPGDLGLDEVAFRQEDNGFVVGGDNDMETVQGLDEINDRPLAQIENHLRTGHFDEPPPWATAEDHRRRLRDDDGLVDVLTRDNGRVYALGMTHRDLALPLRTIVKLYDIGVLKSDETHEVPIGGRLFEVRGELGPRRESSFDDGLRDRFRFTVTDVATGQSLRASSLTGEMIARYGFYGGPGTPLRVAPDDITRVFGDAVEALRGE